jgi:hypothetical protein
LQIYIIGGVFLKKFIGIFIFISSLLLIPSFVGATSSLSDTKNLLEEKAQVHGEEVQYFKNLGFTDEEIQNMTKQEYKDLMKRYKGLAGETEIISEKYYTYYEEYGITIEITKEQFEEKKEKSLSKDKEISIFSNTDSDSNFSIQTTATKLYDSRGAYLNRIQLKNTYNWINAPFSRFVDVIGFSWNSTVSYYPGTAYLLYKVDGIKTETKTALDQKNGNGVAFELDLWEGPAPYHSGYMLQDVTKNSSTAINANIFGHYLHTVTPTWISNISIGYGVISLTGPTVDKGFKTDLLVNFP